MRGTSHILLRRPPVVLAAGFLVITAGVLAMYNQTLINLWFQDATVVFRRRGSVDTYSSRLQVVIKHTERAPSVFRDLCTESDLPDVGAMAGSGYSVPVEPVEDDDKFTLVMVTHNRDVLMRRCLRSYGSMSRIDRIILYWNNPGREPPDLRSEISFRMPLVIKSVNFTTLRHRFQPLEEIKTEAVFIADDDNLIGEEGLNRAFDVWKSHPWGIVGFTWRHYISREGHPMEYTFYVKDKYSMILTNAAFLHKEYLRMYTEALPPGVASMVDAMFNCDDIAMNFLISAHCRCSAAYKVDPSHMVGLSSSGISSGNNHVADRSMCLNKFATFFSEMPLRTKPATCMWSL